MAALRYATRTLGGRALQRTQAAVEEEQRRLLPRLIHNEHPCGKPAAGLRDEKMYIARKIQKKKEELYNLIAEADRKNMIPGWVRRQNRELLQQLSVQVEAKPNDPDWRSKNESERSEDNILSDGEPKTTD